MAPFRPTNLNKRAYPGNASVVGPTKSTSCTASTSTCCETVNIKGSCQQFCCAILGCRCVQNYCACPCCDVCCSCTETTCTRVVPSGMWSSSEQYTARGADEWGPTTCSCGSATCLCCFNQARTDINNTTFTDVNAFTTCIDGNTAYAVVAGSTHDCSQSWQSSDGTSTSWNSVQAAITSFGDVGWFVPNCNVLKCAGYNCRSYWDSYGTTSTYWSSSQKHARYAYHGRFNDGCFCQNGSAKTNGYRSRAFRCIST